MGKNFTENQSEILKKAVKDVGLARSNLTPEKLKQISQDSGLSSTQIRRHFTRARGKAAKPRNNKRVDMAEEDDIALGSTMEDEEDDEANEEVDYDAMDGGDSDEEMNEGITYGFTEDEHPFETTDLGTSAMGYKVSSCTSENNGSFIEQRTKNFDNSIHQSPMANQAAEIGSKKVFVGQLSDKITSDMLFREFEKLGPLASAHVVFDRDSGSSMGYGYVYFIKKLDALSAVELKNGAIMDGRQIWVTLHPDTPEPVELTNQTTIDHITHSNNDNSIRGYRGNNCDGRVTHAADAEAQIAVSDTEMKDGTVGEENVRAAAEAEEQEGGDEEESEDEEEALSHLTNEEYVLYKTQVDELERLLARREMLQRGINSFGDLDDRIRWNAERGFGGT